MDMSGQAWLVPALGVGFYQDAYPENSDPRNALIRALVKGDAAANASQICAQNPYARRLRDEKLCVQLIDDTNKDAALFLEATAVVRLALEYPHSFFSYDFAPTEEAKPMFVPPRMRHDTPRTAAYALAQVEKLKGKVGVKQLTLGNRDFVNFPSIS